jgi:hypothetical protein
MGEPTEPQATEPPKTKGTTFLHVRAFVIERFGERGWAKVIARLSPDDRAELDSVILIGWYSLPLYARLLRAVDEVHGYGDLALVVHVGRFEAEHDLTVLQRVFLRLANPSYVIEKMGDYWRRFHDSGTWDVKRESDRLLTGYLDDWGCVDLALCRELVGYMSRALELVGAKAVILEHPLCRARGDARCYFKARWGGTAERKPEPGPRH